jgi:hypothetical protein
VTDLKITSGPKPTFSAVSIPLFLFQSYNNSLATKTVLIYSYARGKTMLYFQYKIKIIL